jgi:hypothetical protein
MLALYKRPSSQPGLLLARGAPSPKGVVPSGVVDLVQGLGVMRETLRMLS